MRKGPILFIVFTLIFVENSNAFDIPGFFRGIGLFGSGNDVVEEVVRGEICYRAELEEGLEQNARCAEALCLGFNEPSVYLTEDSIEQRFSDQEMQPFDEIAPNLADTIEGLHLNRLNLLNTSKERKEQLFAEIDNMAAEELNRSAYSLFEPLVGNPRWYESDGPQFFRPPEISATELAALEEYATNGFNNRQSFPTVVNSGQSPAEQRQAASGAIREARRRMSDRSNEMTDVARENALRFLDQVGEQVNSGEVLGEELERLLISADNTLRDTIQVGGAQTGLVNEEALANCQSDTCLNGLRQHLKNRLDQVFEEELEGPSSDPTRFVQEKVAYCRSYYAASVMALRQLESDNENFQSTLNQFINQGLSNFSTHSKEHFRNFADAAQHELNPGISVKERPSEILTRLAERPRPPEFQASRSFRNPELINEALNMRRSIIGSSYSTQDICPSQFESPENQIIGHNFSQHFSNRPEDIAYGLGLVLSRAVKNNELSRESSEMFNALRSCAQNHYAQERGTNRRFGTYFEGDDITSDSDFADLMVFKTFPNREAMSSCRFFKDVSNNPSPDDYRLISANVASSRSTPFFRLIQEALHSSRELPNVCLQLITSPQVNNQIRTEPCF